MSDIDFWDYATRTVRVFPDYADTVIWFSDPFPYPGTHLSGALTERMKDWEDSYYAALTKNFEWRSGEESQRFDAHGLELARELALEIGPDFGVEYRPFGTRECITTERSRGPATNPDAQKAFSTRARTHRE